MTKVIAVVITMNALIALWHFSSSSQVEAGGNPDNRPNEFGVISLISRPGSSLPRIARLNVVNTDPTDGFVATPPHVRIGFIAYSPFGEGSDCVRRKISNKFFCEAQIGPGETASIDTPTHLFPFSNLQWRPVVEAIDPSKLPENLNITLEIRDDANPFSVIHLFP
jgi:hypothetical protein